VLVSSMTSMIVSGWCGDGIISWFVMSAIGGTLGAEKCVDCATCSDLVRLTIHLFRGVVR